MHGYRDWNTAIGMLSSAAKGGGERQSPLAEIVPAETTEYQLRGKAVRLTLESSITLEQARFVRSLASSMEQLGVRLEFDLPV